MPGIVTGDGDNRGQDRIFHGGKERLSPQHLSKTVTQIRPSVGREGSDSSRIECFVLDRQLTIGFQV